MATEMQSTAHISDCGLYRYHLTRTWDDKKPPMVFVMLNPSTADASKDDATIRKCIGFAKLYGCGSIEVFNLFAYRATKPAAMWASAYPIGPDNDSVIARRLQALHAVFGPLMVVLAWGAQARRQQSRGQAVLRLVRATDHKILALKTLADGTPAHPLYLPYSSALAPYKPL